MSLTKTQLEETILSLRNELQQEIAHRENLETQVETLHAQNTQLASLLLQATAQYQEFYDYVKRLENWASAFARQNAA